MYSLYLYLEIDMIYIVCMCVYTHTHTHTLLFKIYLMQFISEFSSAITPVFSVTYTSEIIPVNNYVNVLSVLFFVALKIPEQNVKGSKNIKQQNCFQRC